MVDRVSAGLWGTARQCVQLLPAPTNPRRTEKIGLLSRRVFCDFIKSVVGVSDPKMTY